MDGNLPVYAGASATNQKIRTAIQPELLDRPKNMHGVRPLPTAGFVAG
jgi:hypothetical protein